MSVTYERAIDNLVTSIKKDRMLMNDDMIKVIVKGIEYYKLIAPESYVVRTMRIIPLLRICLTKHKKLFTDMDILNICTEILDKDYSIILYVINQYNNDLIDMYFRLRSPDSDTIIKVQHFIKNSTEFINSIKDKEVIDAYNKLCTRLASYYT